MKNILVFGILFLSIFANSLFAENVKDYIKKGNSYYNSKKYKSAEVEYRKALELDPTNNYAKFNLGNAYYRQGNYQEAMNQFDAVNRSKFNKNDLSKAYYNLGNSMMQAQKYEDAIESYKKSLLNNPDDYDAKYNLEYARRMLQQQIQSQNQNKQNDKKQQGDNQQQNNSTKQNQQNKTNQKQQDNQQSQQQSEQRQDNQSEQQKQQQQQKISKEEAERILQALNNEEQQLQKKMKKMKAERGKLEKNW
ncbi:MAG TPA: tetratricopeptide repeat protein [Candidatus Kapabacteria bacterium]|nr:tetratricopeptide repeat protein [Candidatus Kapabacteria bacterium]